VGTTLTNIALFILGIIIWIAIARLLGPTWRGALALVMIAPTIVMKVGTLGFDYGIVVLGGKSNEMLGKLTRTGVFFGMVVGIIFIGLLFVFMYVFPIAFWRLTQEVWLRPQYIIIATVFPIHLMTLMYDAAIYAEDRIAARNIKELVVNTTMLGIILIAVFVFDMRLIGIIGAYVLANVLSLAYAWYLVKGNVPLGGRLDAPLGREAVKLGFPVYLANMAMFLMLPAMMITLSFALPGESTDNLARIAFFTMAYQMVDRILPVTRSIAFALLPKITAASDSEAGELAAKASRHTLVASLIIFALLVLFMHPIVAILLGKRYLAVVGAFTIMAPGGVALSSAGVWSTHLLARAKPLKVATAGIISVVTALVISGIGFRYLEPGREVLIASLAVVVGAFLNAGILLPSFCREGHVRMSRALVPTMEDFREWRRIPRFVGEFAARKRNI
jgi:O-antigen/teichoic acid export membrane protein